MFPNNKKNKILISILSVVMIYIIASSLIWQGVIVNKLNKTLSESGIIITSVELSGKYLHTTKDNFLKTLHISAYSLTEMLRIFSPKMNDNASVIALTYYGSTRYMQSYNVMGVAKAALETSIKYLNSLFFGREALLFF